MKHRLILFALLFLSISTSGQSQLRYEKPPAAAANCDVDDLGDAFTCSYLSALAGAAGYLLGTAGGVYLVGNTGDQTGSFYAAVLGTLGGALVGVIVGEVFLKDKAAGDLILAASPPIFATLVFNSGRRYKSSAQSGFGLIDVRDGRIAVAVPQVYFRLDPWDGRTLTQNINLARISF